MKKLLFVINPISGGIDKSGLVSKIKRSCDRHGLTYDVIETTGDDDQKRIDTQIRKFEADVVIACGGDGTVNLVAQVVMPKSGLKMAILPLGSANGLATELEMPEEVERAVQVIKKGRSLEIDVLRINHEHISLHLSDIGFNAKLIKRFEASGMRGKLGYTRQFFATLFNKKPRKYCFEFDHTRFNQRAEMVVFANAKMYGTGAVVNPDGELNDGKFEVCIFKPYPWYAIFGLALRFFTGAMKRSRYVDIIQTKEVTITSKLEDSLQIDGETIGEFKRVQVKVAKHKLSLIVP